MNRSPSHQPNASSTQPSLAVAAFYAIVSAMALAAAGTSAWFIVSRLDVLAKFMAIDKAYYVLLVLLGLGVAAFLFGAMRSYGSIRGRRFGAAFEFGGPAAGALFVAIVGMELTGSARPFDLTIRFVDMQNISSQDRAEIDLGNRHELVQIGPLGDVIVRDVDPKTKSDRIFIKLISAEWQVKNPAAAYFVPSDSLIRIAIERIPNTVLRSRPELLTNAEILDNMTRQKNSWVSSGSGSLPSE
jgi:hypothetical protein